MKRVMCQECEGEGEFLVMGVYPRETTREDCEPCRGLGWVDPPEEDEDEDRD